MVSDWNWIPTGSQVLCAVYWEYISLHHGVPYPLSITHKLQTLWRCPRVTCSQMLHVICTSNKGNRDNSDWAAGWTTWSSDTGRSKECFFPQNVQNFSGTQLSSYFIGTGVPSLRISGLRVKLTAHPNLQPRLWMSGALPLLALCAFVTWTETYLYFISSWNKVFFCSVIHEEQCS
jgi:hypothetical protein